MNKFLTILILHFCFPQWHPVVLGFAPEAPICLIGCLFPKPSEFGGKQQQPRQQQNEMAASDDNKPYLISTQEGEDAARQIGAVTYIEWTEGSSKATKVMETLVWYGYYYHMSKSPIYPRD
jgi:hypothetical protein